MLGVIFEYVAAKQATSFKKENKNFLTYGCEVWYYNKVASERNDKK
jgi:hypothetical protein